MRVRHEIGIHTGQHQEVIQQISMAVSGMRDPRRFTGEPRAHLIPCIDHWFGSLEHAGIGDQAHEREQAHPRQTDASEPIELLVEPCARGIVLSE